MNKIDFTGQVAVITGAGRGLGRAYADSLADRGARLVINDIGTDPSGHGSDPDIAEAAAEDIRRRGGEAISSFDDIATEEGGAALIRKALHAYGRIDMLAVNAGSVVMQKFSEMPVELVRAQIDVHLMSAFYVGQPAWRVMAAQNYGRILLVSSMIFGHAQGGTPYACGKSAMISLARFLAADAEAGNLDIRVNVISPYADSRLTGGVVAERHGATLATPATPTAVALFLLSSACPVNGETFHAGAGHVARVCYAVGQGWASGRPDISPEEIIANIGEINSMKDCTLPKSTFEFMDWLQQRTPEET